MFEAVGSVAAGTMTMDELSEFEEKVCPTCGSCSGMYTANSMNCLTEALGMGLRGNGTIPAVYSERIRLAKHAGMKVMELLEKNIRPRDIMTKEAILNALTVDMALGCSTNSMLHLPAIAHEVGFDFDIKFANEISAESFDGRGNYALGIKEQIIFPEIEYDKIDKVRGMDVIITTTAKTDEEARELLRMFNMPFKN